MKILIADDCPTRYGELLQRLTTLGVDNVEDVTIVTCAYDALCNLERQYYDLLILDIILPFYKHDQATTHTHSLDLLHQIHVDDEIIKPGRVIGITADKAAAVAASVQFDENTWVIIDYAEQSDTWMSRIVNCVQYLKHSAHPENILITNQSVDVAIICALESPEFEAILGLPWNWGAARPIDDSVFVRDGWFLIGESRVTVVATFASRMGMISTAIKSASLINALSPTVMVMTGICAGVKEKVQLGDVLFADPVWDFQSGKRLIDAGTPKFSSAPHQLPADHKIRAHFEQLRSEKAFFNELPSMYSAECKFKTTLHVGPVASGSAVLADGHTIEEIKHQQRDLLGVEMEIYGLYAAAVAANGQQPKTFALKGVCDFADPDKENEAQRYAAFASAKVLEKFFQVYGSRFFGKSNEQ
ncbi:Response regulator receiver domain protein [Paucimonas lemoignei]|nr:Response regulator receiver domain protein [Paucimonas lemoignei]